MDFERVVTPTETFYVVTLNEIESLIHDTDDEGKEQLLTLVHAQLDVRDIEEDVVVHHWDDSELWSIQST